jgi:hypothetical protein
MGIFLRSSFWKNGLDGGAVARLLAFGLRALGVLFIGYYEEAYSVKACQYLATRPDDLA